MAHMRPSGDLANSEEPAEIDDKKLNLKKSEIDTKMDLGSPSFPTIPHHYKKWGDSQHIKTSAEVVKTSKNKFLMQKGTLKRPSEKTRWETDFGRVTNKASRIIFSRCRLYRRLRCVDNKSSPTATIPMSSMRRK
uniref:Uncharacterized protein n=1 Tax=Cucumis melo TaxID=3656 RepID=A0A9I9DQ53_CUCME